MVEERGNVGSVGDPVCLRLEEGGSLIVDEGVELNAREVPREDC